MTVDVHGNLWVLSAPFTASSFTSGPAVTGSAIVAPVAIVNDSAGNVFELDNYNNEVRLNAIVGGSVTKTAVLPLGTDSNSLAHDPASGYTYVLSDDSFEALQVYPSFAGTGSTLLPLATVFLAQGANAITVDANYVYVSSANNVTLYPKYDPSKPYAAWRPYKRLSRGLTSGTVRR